MSTRTYLTSFTILLLLGLSFFTYVQDSGPSPLQITPIATSSPILVSPQLGKLAPSEANTVVPAANAEIRVASTAYPITVRGGETLFEAMQALSLVGTFTFTGRDYAGLGFFVESINGVPNAGGKYWVFYLNGVSSTEGVSLVKLKQGDLVEWKFRSKE